MMQPVRRRVAKSGPPGRPPDGNCVRGWTNRGGRLGRFRPKRLRRWSLRGPLHFHYFLLNGVADQARHVVQIEFPHELVAVSDNRLDAHLEALRNIAAGKSGGDEPENLALTRGQGLTLNFELNLELTLELGTLRLLTNELRTPNP